MTRRKISLLFILSFLNLAAVVSRGVPLFFEINHPLRWLVVGILAIYAALIAIIAFIKQVYPRHANIYFAIQTILILALLITPQNDPRTTDFFAILFIPLCIQAVFYLPRKMSYGWVVGFALVSTMALILRYGMSEGVKFSFSYGLGFALNTLLAVFFINAESASAELKKANQQLQEYAAQVEELAITKERNRLARELHDSVTQYLHSSTLLAEAGQRLAGSGDIERARGYLIRLGEISQQALKEMRLLVYELHLWEVSGLGLVGALQQRLEAVERRSGVEVQFSIEEEFELPARMQEELFRFAMEALNNALKHANHTRVRVALRKVEKGDIPCLELSIMDNGIGFDQNAKGGGGGMGLVSMRERIEKLSGELTILSTPGEGTQVTACVNLEKSLKSPSTLEI